MMVEHVQNEYQELMVDYLEEVYDISDMVDILTPLPRGFINEFIKVLKEELGWYARIRNNPEYSQRLKDLIEHLEVL